MSVLQFTSDIVNDVLFRAGEPTDGTSDFEAQALEYINRAYRAIWMGGGEFAKEMNEPWLWLKKDPPGVLILNPLVDDGTVTVTNNSATVTLSVAPAASMAGRFFQVSSHGDVFRISIHTGGSTTLTLDSVYTGESGSGLTYRLMKLEYTLPTDCLRIIAPMRSASFESPEVHGTDTLTLDRDYPISIIQGGYPTRFGLVTESKIRFNAYGGDDPEDLIRLEFDYLAKPADLTDSGAEEPLLPLQYRQLLADGALYMLWAVKNDDRAADMLASTQAGLRSMAADNRARMAQIGQRVGHIYVRGRNRFPATRMLVVG